MRFSDLETTKGIQQVEQAAFKLQKALQTKVEGEINQIHAISERMALFGKESTSFATRLIDFLKEMMRAQVGAPRHVTTLHEKVDLYVQEEAKPMKRANLRFQHHGSMEEQLLQYRTLVRWLKDMDPRKHCELQMVSVSKQNDHA